MAEPSRHTALRAMLEQRRIQVRDDVRRRMRAGRTRQEAGRDAPEQTDDDTRTGLAFSLIEMQSETLTQIDRALARLEAGRYGTCVRCDGIIAEQRLQALPFAMRCQACEERRERAQPPPSAADGRGETTVFARAGSR